MNELAQKESVFKRIISFFRKPLFKYIVIRIFNSFITLILIISAVFVLLRMMPKDKYINEAILVKIPVAQREEYKNKIWARYGLLDPIPEQLWNYFRDLNPLIVKEEAKCINPGYGKDWVPICKEYQPVRVYFGKSIAYKRDADIYDLVVERFPISFKMSMLALVVTYTFAYPLGVFMAKGKGKLIDKLGNGYIVFSSAVPGLIFYYAWLIIGMKLNFKSVFVVNDYRTWIMPIWAMSFTAIAGTAMWVRRYMVDEMNSDYVKFARSKGLSESTIMFKHVLRNAIVPLIRTIPAALIFAIVGSYFVEKLWNIPGSGQLLIKALQEGDNPLVQALTILYAGMSMIASLLGDLVTVFFDPRISLTKTK